MWAMTNQHANPEFQGARQRGGDAQLRVRGRGTGTTPMSRKKGHGSKTPAPQDWPFLQGGWSYAPAETCQATRRLPISWHHEHVIKDPQNTEENKPRRKINDSDWGLRRRSFSAGHRWLVSSRSKSVSRATLRTLVVESLSKPSSRRQGYTDPATLNDWWAFDSHQHWAWQWDFTWRSRKKTEKGWRKKKAAACKSETPSFFEIGLFLLDRFRASWPENICFRRAVFQLLQVGHQWLSETTPFSWWKVHEFLTRKEAAI